MVLDLVVSNELSLTIPVYMKLSFRNCHLPDLRHYFAHYSQRLYSHQLFFIFLFFNNVLMSTIFSEYGLCMKSEKKIMRNFCLFSLVTYPGGNTVPKF